jgi:DNA repair protein RAD57
MTDLLRVLPHFPVAQYATLIPVLEKHQLTTSDLLTLDATDIGKRTKLPLLDVKSLSNAVVEALHAELGVADKPVKGPETSKDGGAGAKTTEGSAKLRHTADELQSQWATISTLDSGLDVALNGGIPTGYVTEITGESGVGKTQLLMTLLLAVQLPPPHGLSRTAMYISTEAALSTRRLSQLLTTHPMLRSATQDATSKVSFDNVISTTTADLESQDHILAYQVPVVVERRNIGLIVLDSVAANYRAEFERGEGRVGGSNMAARSAELVRLGMTLRELARKHNLAVVVANQVADRFSDPTPVSRRDMGAASQQQQERTNIENVAQEGGRSDLDSVLSTHGIQANITTSLTAAEPTPSLRNLVPRSSSPHPTPSYPRPNTQFNNIQDDSAAVLTLDHQQRWFTGWGDDPSPPVDMVLKTPSLGLVWSTQIACRIALFKRPSLGGHRTAQKRKFEEERDGGDSRAQQVVDEAGGLLPTVQTWRRWMKVVFAPHAPPSGPAADEAVEFKITAAGLQAVEKRL